MKGDNPEGTSSLIPHQSQDLATPLGDENRILGEMVNASLVITRQFAMEQTDLEALVREGKKLLNSEGKGITEANRKAFSLFLRAAEGGSLEAQRLVGCCYMDGHGVSIDYAEAIKWLRKSAASANVNTYIRLALLNQNRVLPKNEEEAIIWYRKAAEAGATGVCSILARIYKDRNNHAEELRWNKMAALQGDPDFFYAIGRIYESADTVNADPPEAYAWSKLIVEVVGWYGKHQRLVVELESKLSPSAIEEGNRRYQQYTEEASGWIRKKADRGVAEAQSELGWRYEKGKGVPQDFAEAVRWYRKAADAGQARAQARLGHGYAALGKVWQQLQEEHAETASLPKREGLFEEVGAFAAEIARSHPLSNKQDADLKEYQETAAKWLLPAAKAGYRGAQVDLATCYLTGTGLSKNRGEALRWYKKAAELGHPTAQTILRKLEES